MPAILSTIVNYIRAYSINNRFDCLSHHHRKIGAMKQAMRSQTASCGPQAAHSLIPLTRCRRQRQCSTQAVAIPEIASIASSVQTLVDTIASAAPEPLQPAVQVIGGDIASVAALSPTMAGLARLTVRAQNSSGRGPHPHTLACTQLCTTNCSRRQSQHALPL